jgi:hypothetical protein
VSAGNLSDANGTPLDQCRERVSHITGGSQQHPRGLQPALASLGRRVMPYDQSYTHGIEMFAQ